MMDEAERLGAQHVIAEVSGLVLEPADVATREKSRGPTSSNYCVAGVRTADGRTFRAKAVAVCMGPWTHRASTWLPDDVPPLPHVGGSMAHSISMRPSLPGAETLTPHAIFIDYKGKGKMQHPEIYPRPGEQPAPCQQPSAARCYKRSDARAFAFHTRLLHHALIDSMFAQPKR
jgi:glycine/D-amino acid oxidase-like deaminating enzyme